MSQIILILYLFHSFENVTKVLHSVSNGWRLACKTSFKLWHFAIVIWWTIWHRNFKTSFATINNGQFFATLFDSFCDFFCISIVKCCNTCHINGTSFCVLNLCVINSDFLAVIDQYFRRSKLGNCQVLVLYMYQGQMWFFPPYVLQQKGASEFKRSILGLCSKSLAQLNLKRCCYF